jgi:hypothetical protein
MKNKFLNFYLNKRLYNIYLLLKKVTPPQVLFKYDEKGNKLEPYEKVRVEVEE